MAKEIINDPKIVFDAYAKRNPVKLAQRKAQLEAALKSCSPHLKKGFEEQIKLMTEALK